MDEQKTTDQPRVMEPEQTQAERTAQPAGAAGVGTAGERSTGWAAGGGESSEGAEMRQTAEDLTERMRISMGRMAESGVHRIANEIRTIGAASHAAADRLEGDETHERIGRYVDDMTRRFENTADYLERRGVDGLIDDAGDVARRNPAMFLAGAAIAGFALGRVLSATRPGSRARGQAGSRSGQSGMTEERSSI